MSADTIVCEIRLPLPTVAQVHAYLRAQGFVRVAVAEWRRGDFSVDCVPWDRRMGDYSRRVRDLARALARELAAQTDLPCLSGDVVTAMLRHPEQAPLRFLKRSEAVELRRLIALNEAPPPELWDLCVHWAGTATFTELGVRAMQYARSCYGFHLDERQELP